MFFLIPVVAAGLTTLLAAKVGAKAVEEKILCEMYCRSKGFKKGEGPPTRLDGDMPTLVHPGSPSDLGRSLAAVATAFPQRFGWSMGKQFKFTHSEGEDMRQLLQPLFRACGKPSLPDRMEEYQGDIATTIDPVGRYLEGFPKERVK